MNEKKFKIEDVGEQSLSGCDELNIPVCSHIEEPDNENKKWVWFASNYMPRKGHVSEIAYEIRAKTKEDILAAVRMYVVPLYEKAVSNLSVKGENYFWE